MINPSFKKLSEINNSRYALCVMVSKRARMLIDGKETKLKKQKPNQLLQLWKKLWKRRFGKINQMNKNILLGVTGGIAIYKVVDVVSRLKNLTIILKSL